MIYSSDSFGRKFVRGLNYQPINTLKTSEFICAGYAHETIRRFLEPAAGSLVMPFCPVYYVDSINNGIVFYH